MKLFEYQAKEAFRAAGIAIPKAALIYHESEIDEALARVGLPCMLKAQVLRGGRGKAGLIRRATTRDEAVAQALFQSDPPVRKILVEEAVSIAREIYLSVTVDADAAQALIIACAEGGVEIEQLAHQRPEALVMERVDIDRGLSDFQVRNILFQMGINGAAFKPVSAVIHNLYATFRRNDAELAEINPLFVTTDGQVVAGDGKLVIDDNSMARQPKYELTREYFNSDAEYEAALEGIPYIQFDGDISLMCAGAGLTTTVFDLIHYSGGTVANYLEFGGAHYKKARRAMELCLKNECKVILVVTFGTIARADVMAEGLVDAIVHLKPQVLVITCIRGTNEEQAVEILKSAGLTPLFDTEEAVRQSVAIAAGRMP